MKSIDVRDLGRVRRIAQVLARWGFGELAARVGGEAAPTGDMNAPYAVRLRSALVELGPTFIKLGQVLSMRPDILPPDLIAELRTLQHDVEPMGEDDVRAVLEAELPVPFEEAFTTFDFKPLGAASIAQVHAATLSSGEQVAVKLQRRGIEPIITSDLHILYTAANLLEGRIDLPGLYTPAAIIREFDAAIHRELDFLQEAKATARMKRVLADAPCIVPGVHPKWSTRRMLVQERIYGVPLSAAVDGLPLDQRRTLAHQLMDATYRQVFDDGFFHGDPHPGNLFVTPDGTLAFLDFGVTGQLTARMQDTILSTFTSLVFRDPDNLASTIYRAGATRERIDLREFRDALERKMVQYYGASLDDLATRDTLLDVVEMAKHFRIDLPSEFAVLARALTLVEGNLRRMLPDVDIVAEVRPYAERLMARRFAPERLARDAASAILQLEGQVRELPTQASQVLVDLDAGRLTLVTRDPDAPELRETIRRATMRLSLAMVFGGSTVGGVLALGASSTLATSLLLIAAFTFVVLSLSLVAPESLDAGAWRRSLWRTWRFFTPRRPPPPREGSVPMPRTPDPLQ